MSHTHTHDGQTHTHPPAGEHPPAGGPVVLDIGDGVGALIVHLPARLIGQELFLRPDPADPATIHTGIWERTANGRTMVVAVFAELLAGTYTLVDPDGGVDRTVTVDAGAVHEIHLQR